MAILYKFEQHTQELVSINHQIITLTEEYKTQFHPEYKSVNITIK
ncbi:MAG: hypothetical protein ACRC76_05760 [Proteocatella sp.]